MAFFVYKLLGLAPIALVPYYIAARVIVGIILWYFVYLWETVRRQLLTESAFFLIVQIDDAGRSSKQSIKCCSCAAGDRIDPQVLFVCVISKIHNKKLVFNIAIYVKVMSLTTIILKLV